MSRSTAGCFHIWPANVLLGPCVPARSRSTPAAASMTMLHPPPQEQARGAGRLEKKTPRSVGNLADSGGRSGTTGAVDVSGRGTFWTHGANSALLRTSARASGGRQRLRAGILLCLWSSQPVGRTIRLDDLQEDGHRSYEPLPRPAALLGSEVLDWGRFDNRRQVASYTGLCPSEQSSGGKRKQGSINKHGNPRVRHQLVEAVWRLEQWQPEYPIGYFHIDIAEVQTAEGRLYLFVAIDRTSKFAFVQLHQKATRRVAGDFLRALIQTLPYKIHTVLTDNGTHFTTPGCRRSAAADIKEALVRGECFRAHSFELACAQNDIDHRLTLPKHPWTNGQVERMNRTIKEATVRRYHYETHQHLKNHLADFINAYNFARRLKTLKGLTPYEYICKIWSSEPQRFTFNPLHQMPGLNT